MSSLKVYKIDQGYIGKINTEDLKIKKANAETKFIVILDQSGSMGSSVRNITNHILPMILEKLDMTKSQVELITFSNDSDRYTGDSDYFKNLNINCQGGTYMVYAVRNLEKVFNEFQMKNEKFNIRLLTLSDGDLFDQKETLKAASELCDKFKNIFTINSQAIRFFTSYSEPDTRGLSSMLQYNTITEPQLIDIQASSDYETISDTIANLFKDDGLNYKITLNASDAVFKENPWNESSSSIDLIKGENIFWLEKLPETITLEGATYKDVTDCDDAKADTEAEVNDKNDNDKIEVKIEKADEVTVNNYKTILDKKIEYFMKKLKVLKVVNTESSLKEMNLIIQYFETFEDKLSLSEMNINEVDKIHLSSRMKALKKIIQKRNLSVAGRMKEIKNDDRVNQLNSKQLADFLRNVSSSKDGKSLSRRGLGEGIEFDDVARREVLAMSEHLDELKDIDDSNHTKSFYSTSTTLEGIKTVCELAEDKEVLENATAIDIIKLLNIVGIGCDSPIRNYTDPMIYQINDIFLGCYISLSDVLATTEYNNGQNALEDFNTKRIIVNTIPIFDDQRIHKFLLKYAPKLLEYTASIGMRRILVDIPYTYEYLYERAIFKLCEDFSEKRSEAAIRLFSNLIESYELASGDHFNFLNDIITRQMDASTENNELSKYHIFLNDCTIDNMIMVFINLIKENKTSIIPKVLRHLFCHEAYRVFKKFCKNHNFNEEFIQSYLDDLLGIDYEKNKTDIPELFHYEENPKFCDDYTINMDKLNEFYGLKESTEKDTAYRTNTIPFVPSCLGAYFSDNKIDAIKNLEDYNDTNFKKALGINYDLSYFRMFAFVQAFLYRKNDERMDETKKVMKIIDIGDFEEANKMVKEKVRQLYQSHYNKEIATKDMKENEIVEDELVELMLSCDDIKNFIKYFNEGITRGNKTVTIENIYSPALQKLVSKIIDPDKKNEIPLIIKKTSIILLGRDDQDNIVWNKGNAYRGPERRSLEEIISINDPEFWSEFSVLLKKRSIHIYRDESNRHGHSNDLPSYWAFGYNSLEEMFASVSQEEIDEYKRNHIGCCGL